tara:strand:- start:1147 stop:2274 length:1128 start_codon:yes stop_codon:yes gene_type:complete
MALTQAPAELLNLDSGITISTADNSTQLTLTSTDADSSAGPVLELFRNSGSPADNDATGLIYFYGENDNDEKIAYGQIYTQVKDASDGTEDGSMAFYTMAAGTSTETLSLVSGNVGIGATPSSNSGWNKYLSIKGGSNNAVVLDGTDSQEGAIGALDGLYIDVTGHTTATNNKIIFRTQSANSNANGIERMRLTSDGLFFIGKTASSLTDTGVEIHPSGIVYATSTDTAQAYYNRENSHGVQLQGRKDNSNVWSISSNANSLASDRNFKKDIADLQLGLDFVKELKPKTFRFKMDKETDPLMTGLIAQDLEQSLTDAGVEKNSMTLVQHEPQEDESESQYMVDYSKLIPVLIKGMQEQQDLIETLQTKVKTLEEA